MESERKEFRLPLEKIRCAVLSVLAVAIVAALGSAFTDATGAWYQALIKPAFTPPPVVFGIVWPILYALIAWSAARVCSADLPAEKKRALLLFFAINGALNALWSYVFFERRNLSMALFVLLLLILSTVSLQRQVQKADKKAGALLIPYLVWIIFAAVLNYAIAMLN